MMKTKLSIIALLLMTVNAPVHAFDFGVKAVNSQNANTTKWACKKCNAQSTTGNVGLSIGGSISDDDNHSANALGYDDGFAGAIDANAATVTDSGIRTEFYAKELGSKRGDAAIAIRQPGLWSVAAGYDAKYRVDSTTASSNLVSEGNTLVAQDGLVVQTLDQDRDRVNIDAKYRGDNWSGFVSVSNEEKTGKRASSYSLGLYSATNFVQPVNSETTNLHTAINMSGSNWLAEVGFKGSWFDNDVDNVYLDQTNPLLIQTGSPDNSAMSFYISGRYRFDNTTITGKFSNGEQNQDESFSSLLGVSAGLTSQDLTLNTTDANLAFVTRISSKATVKGSFVYSDRDNDSPSYEFDQYQADELTGLIAYTNAMDRESTTSKLSADYRIKSGHKLSAGLAYKDSEQTITVREEKDETELWVKYRYDSLEMWDMRFKASYAERDGAEFTKYITSDYLQNEFMRKYDMADRERTEFVVDVTHTPLDNLSIDFRGYYALDDYNDTDIGLTESKDYGYDASANLQLADTLDVTVYGGYQWIDNDQLGSTTSSYADWAAENSDEFGFVGLSTQYTGLADYGVLLSAEYCFSYSEGDTAVSGSIGNLGEYESEEHSFEFNATYALTQTSTVGLKYQYTDYQDSDYAEIPVVNKAGDGVTNLTTLGYLSQDYDAHLIMATYNYTF
ncbi:MtrB/PioB family decaheme-associated outer membrane protein [Shewanella livingstonensis]|uniref:MtrB/PioB family decaheme-associated outer membrane protein n=1 Tax=Shewanella livingstonensis TaxID=150120 RepID=A0A3G8LVW0_9GAMM|nr:MtrB/PioB family decaheme-associated outer membrane protein [Shewanella livingstonensis]AZG73285.1 MtrB/PioB family decaheme-associated outer membrane protein [Shewanella livingstonensis]